MIVRRSGSSEKPAASFDAAAVVQRVIDRAVGRRASDIHLEPQAGDMLVRFRVDGMLETVETLPTEAGNRIVNRLMVLAHLLTYRQDVPQEGRATVLSDAAAGPVELRLAIMPTAHGLRAAIRLPAELSQPRLLAELGLPAAVLAGLERFAKADAGLLLVAGPAGSGKTTTIYALLDHVLRTQPGLSIIALEDPIERDLPGVTQIQVQPFGELTYERALRSIFRQDPQLLMLGEIRDAATATIALQAALSGHRLIATLHAASPGSAIARLMEMNLEPYQITGALAGVVTQRLLRRRTGDGYRGRFPVGEVAMLDEPLREAILARRDAQAIGEMLARRAGYETLAQSALRAAAGGLTDEAEVRRVLGVERIRPLTLPSPRNTGERVKQAAASLAKQAAGGLAKKRGDGLE